MEECGKNVYTIFLTPSPNDFSILQVTRYLSDCYCNCSSFSGSGYYRVSYDGANTYSLGVKIFNPAANAKVFDRDIRVMRASLIWQISSGSSCGHFQVKSGNRILEHFVYDGQDELRLDITNQLNEMIRNNGSSFDMLVEPESEGDCNSYIYLKNAVGASVTSDFLKSSSYLVVDIFFPPCLCVYYYTIFPLYLVVDIFFPPCLCVYYYTIFPFFCPLF